MLGIGYRNGIAPCHYGCAAFQGGWEEGGNYLVIHEHQINSVEVGISKHYLFVHFINWKTLCVWLTPVVLYSLVAPDNSSKHGVSVIIFYFILLPFSLSASKYSYLSRGCAGNAVSTLLYQAPLNVCDHSQHSFLLMKPLMYDVEILQANGNKDSTAVYYYSVNLLSVPFFSSPSFYMGSWPY